MAPKTPLAENLIQDWHPTKNGNLLATDVSARTSKRVWWLGKECGHEWYISPTKRTLGGGCVVCSGKQILIGFNDLPTINPALANEWHPTKNLPLLITQITAGATKKVWWICSYGHEWTARVYARLGSLKRNGTKCPYCSNSQILPGFNDLATHNPLLASEWHPTKNNGLAPNNCSPNANRKVWWIGSKCGHEWSAVVASRNAGTGCPICYGRQTLSGFNDLATTHPEIALEWHPTKNNGVSASQVGYGTPRKFWWICSKGHEWKVSINSRSGRNTSGCPTCCGRKVLVGFNDLATTHPKIIPQWHSIKNLPLTPQDVTHGTDLDVWWICRLGHEWVSNLAAKRKNKIGCAVCVGQKVLVGFNDLATINPSLSLEWHPTNNKNLLPTMIVANSKKVIWWQCKMNHEWKATANGRHWSKIGCPYCSNRKVLAGFNDFATKNTSYLKEWHPTKNLPLLPSELTFASDKRVWWLCSERHEWNTRIADRRRGEGCPKCVHMISKGEQALADFVIDKGLSIKQNDRNILSGLELDIYIPSHKFAIEYNGVYWHTENRGKDKNYHRNKWLVCKDQGIQLVQIWEDEWNKNPEQIKAMLLHKLGLSQQEKVFARKTIIVELDKKCIEPFLEEHHIQGYAAGSHYLGLKDKNSHELVSVMVLKKEKDNALNIIRYATSQNVVGGFTKLLTYAEKAFSPSKFTTFSDHCVSDGGLYQNNGFIIDKELAPDYKYVVKAQRQHKFGYRLKRFKDDPNLKWKEGMTERELAVLNGLPRIWDAGKTRWVKYIYFS